MKKFYFSFLFFVSLAIVITSPASAAETYIVKKGDTLWEISQRFNVPFAVVLELNKSLKNPNMIFPNDEILLPDGATENPSKDEINPSAQAEKVLNLVNTERQKQGLSSLRLAADLTSVANEKAKDMAVNRYFAHNSPTYGTPVEMLKRFGIKYRSAGENIAAGQKTPEEVMKAWLNSSGHRANILSQNYTEIGIGYYKGGQYGTYWTQIFVGR